MDSSKLKAVEEKKKAEQKKVEQEKLSNDLASKNLDFISSQRDELTRLKLSEDQILDIEKQILNISTKDLADKKKVLDIVNRIYTTNGLNDKVAKSLVESLGIQLDRNEGLFKASSKTLKNRQEETKELTRQTQLIKEIEAKTSLTAQTIQFGRQNVSAEERSRLDETRRGLERRRDIASARGRDLEVQNLNRQIANINQQSARVSGDKGFAGIETSARNIFSQLPKSFKTFRKEDFEALQDPNVDPFAVIRAMDFTREKRVNKMRAERGGKGVPLPPTIPAEDILKFENIRGGLEQQLINNERTEQESIKAAQDNTLSIKDLARINMGLSKDLAPFSTSESAEAQRRAQAQLNVISGKDRSGGNVNLELRRLTMERGVFDRIGEAIPTALENSDQLNESLKDASLSFAHNIGNAMLDAIEKGGDLSDVLLGTAAEFLSTMSRAFMKSAVDDILGSFVVGKQGGGPISGGSGTKDDVPAMLMGGEFVMNKKAVRKYGMGFMSALNNGSLQGFASGGQVRDKEGMFTTPGMNGAGAIRGASDLLSFATQTPVAMNRDTITSSGAFLDAESGRMTMFGRRNNPQFQKVQDAKRQAFDLYASEIAAEQQAIEQEKANKKALMDSLKGAAISAVASVGIKSMAAGFKAGFSGTEGSFGAKFGAGLKGTLFGGNEFEGQTFGGLSNLFTGRGFQSGIPQATPFTPQAPPFTPKSASVSPSIYSGPIVHRDAQGNDALDGLSAEDRGLYDTDPFKTGALPKLATGGLIPAAGGVDTVPAMLSGGEFVMNAAATRNIGAGNLQAINSGTGVGDNSDLVAKLEELILATEASQSTGEINITVNGSNGTDTQNSGPDATDQQKQLSERIKVAVKQVIADEKRLGGQLRR